LPFRPFARRLALVAASALLVLSGCDCGRECTVPADCPDPDQTCDQGKCVANPDAGPTCSPACPTAQFCDTASLTCKNCDGTLIPGSQVNRNCTPGQPVCDTAASGGLGQCRSCAPTSMDGGTDQGCGGATTVCDPALNSGNGSCVVCTGRGGCGNGRVCDTSVGGGICRTCIASTDGGVAVGCTAAEPICNQAQGRCLVCNATAGCASGTICDPAANGGKGACLYCRPSTTGGVAPGCTAASPVCDLSRDGGLGACIVCNVNTDCTGGTVCDVSGNSGTGACKYCYDGPGSTDPGCSSGSPLCNTAGDGGLGTCVSCLASADCTTPPNLVCDTSVNRCVVCTLAQGCSLPQVCDPALNAGQGACIGCTGNQDCATDGGSATPLCRTTPPPGVCVECLSNAECTGTRPACNASGICGCASSADCTGAAGTPVCDRPFNNGNGICRFCTPTEGCTPDAPFCSNNTACICRDNLDCPVGRECVAATSTCQPVSPGGAQGGLETFADSGVGAVDILIDGAYITSFKPAIGSFTNDPPGFFVQAQAGGPAMYVATHPIFIPVDGGPLAVGDRVQFQVLNKVLIGTTQMPAAMLPDGGSAVSGMTVLSSNHPVRNLDTASPAGLTVDVSSAVDLGQLASIPAYQGRLVRLAGFLDGGFAASGTDHLQADLHTSVITGPPLPRLRLPTDIIDALDVGQGCRVTLRVGPAWRFQGTLQPTTYSAADIAVTGCPFAPTVLYAYALNDTSVEVTFDHIVDPATVDVTDFDIPGLVVMTALPNGRKIVLGTTPHVPGTRYTVTVSNVSTLYGVAIGATGNKADFTAYAPAPTGLVINEIDYDNPGTDNFEYIELYNGSGASVDLGGLELVLVNGGDTAPIHREYNRFRLINAANDAGVKTAVLPAGGYFVLGRGDAGVLTLLVPVPDDALRMTFSSADTVQNGVADGVGLLHYATGTLVDSVVYEPIVANEITTFTVATGVGDRTFNFAEGNAPTTAADISSDAGAIVRQPNGTDTNNNNADFRFVIPYTPGSANP
jgi:lamin tail-like protein